MGNVLAFLGRDLAVDLGTANTLVYVRGRGVALNEPSVVALNTDTGKIVAVGVQAKRRIRRTPGNIVAGSPLRGGVLRRIGVTQGEHRPALCAGRPPPAPAAPPGGGGRRP